jgi:uncharacterized protein (TIGR02145 family)
MKKLSLIFSFLVGAFILTAWVYKPNIAFNNNFEGVKIGNQLWMKENLNVDKFQNGDAIPEVKTKEEWEKAWKNKLPAFCYFDNDPTNGNKYGKLYNWHAVNDPRGLSPKGWHTPSDSEWGKLIDYLGGEKKAGTKMKSISGWAENGNGTNESGFNGIPGGYRTFEGDFFDLGNYGYWYSNTETPKEFDIDSAWGRSMNEEENVSREGSSKGYGYSVRCIKD